jgi:hypothetical protein
LEHLEAILPLKTIFFVLVKSGAEFELMESLGDSQRRLDSLSEVLAVVGSYSQGVGTAARAFQDVQGETLSAGAPSTPLILVPKTLWSLYQLREKSFR